MPSVLFQFADLDVLLGIEKLERQSSQSAAGSGKLTST
jgi:hypothetical protein